MDIQRVVDGRPKNKLVVRPLHNLELVKLFRYVTDYAIQPPLPPFQPLPPPLSPFQSCPRPFQRVLAQSLALVCRVLVPFGV
jgi:hypothetical protein